MAINFLNTVAVDENVLFVDTVNDRVGIGTTSPDAKLSVVGATSTNDLIGGSINLATSSGWVIPSGAMSTRVGYYGGDFTLNGSYTENGMEWGLGPFNDRQLLWTTIGSTDSNQDGGWNKTLTNLDIESPYLSVVYFKRVSSNASGNFYHGTGNNILNLDGTSNTNPYFQVRALSLFDQDVWYASVGVIQSNSDSNTTAYADISGLYRLDTGVKVVNSNAFKFDSTGATLSRGHRAYLYYSTDTSVVGHFANPGFYKIDGDQPKLHDIVSGDSDDVFWSANGNDIYNDNSGRVGIGTTTPAYTLQVGDGTEDSIITAFYSDAQYTELHGYGLYMSRAASYIRPVTTTTQTLYIGTPSQIWNAISHDANTHLFSTGGTEHMRISSAGAIKFNAYGAGTLVSDASGNITAVTSGIGGSGATNSIPMFTAGTTIGDSIMSQANIGSGSAKRITVSGRMTITGNGGDADGGTVNLTAPSARLGIATNSYPGTITEPEASLDVGKNARIRGSLNVGSTNEQYLFVSTTGDNPVGYVKMGYYGSGVEWGSSTSTTRTPQYSTGFGSGGKVVEDARYYTFKISFANMATIDTTPRVLIAQDTGLYTYIVEDFYVFQDNANSNSPAPTFNSDLRLDYKWTPAVGAVRTSTAWVVPQATMQAAPTRRTLMQGVSAGALSVSGAGLQEGSNTAYARASVILTASWVGAQSGSGDYYLRLKVKKVNINNDIINNTETITIT